MLGRAEFSHLLWLYFMSDQIVIFLAEAHQKDPAKRTGTLPY